MPHGQVSVGGPGMTAILVLLAATGVASVAVLVHAAWRARRASSLLLALPALAYVAALAWGFLSNGAGSSPRAILITILVAVPADMVYLVRAIERRRRDKPGQDERGPDVSRSDEDPLDARST